jgi:hypothetical protein
MTLMRTYHDLFVKAVKAAKGLRKRLAPNTFAGVFQKYWFVWRPLTVHDILNVIL